MIRKVLAAAAVATLVASGSVGAQAARDYIFIVGSSTVYPFATVVAENFGRSTSFKTPKIESTGSGGGLKLFCAGVGVEHPDITNSSRRIKDTEVKTCAENGVTNVVEIKVGYDGIVMANDKSAPTFNLSRRDIYLALAKKVPNPKEPSATGVASMVDNPYKTWKDVNPELPNLKIEVLGPPPTSGTRDAFAELAMEGGCKDFEWIKELKGQDKSAYKAVCHTVREDGAYIEAGENDNLIVQKLQANPDALGVFGFSFLDQNGDKIKGNPIDGFVPTFDDIADGSYPVSRPLFFYVKAAHAGVIPGIPQYLAEFTSEKAWGPDGYLADRGLIPMPKEEREQFARAAKDLTPLKLAAN